MIFQQYTGNALLNNALQTVEALTEVKHISDVSKDKLKQLIAAPIKGRTESLIDLNTRLKSYTMLFSRNGPLLNDAKFGKRIYADLLNRIVDNFENQGDYLCEISGLRFQITFEDFYRQTLQQLGFDKKQIEDKDTSLNRCWLPLAGSLGSDAQALPQATFTIKTHPICLVVLQFLPLSALLYKGGILLIDSANFDFSRDFVASNTNDVINKIKSLSGSVPIENIKDYTKGHYLLKALDIFEEKEVFGDQYTDLNLWNFSNSGTGASCQIDRVPNSLFVKLLELDSTATRHELRQMLTSKIGHLFLEALNDNKDFWGLYPSKEYEGVSVLFFEAYQKVIKNARLLEYAKYIAGLFSNTNLAKIEKTLLSQKDAYAHDDYPILILRTLVEAASKNKWNVEHHTQILDDSAVIPIRAATYKIHKLVHFYYQKEISTLELPDTEGVTSNALLVSKIFIDMLNKNKEERGGDLIEDLKGVFFQEPSLNGTIIRLSTQTYSFEQLYALIYTTENKQAKYGLRELLRIYFNNPINLPNTEGYTFLELTEEQKEYLKDIEAFAVFYFNYYNDKYINDYEKFKRHVLKPMRSQTFQFMMWINEAFDNMKVFYKDEQKGEEEENRLNELQEKLKTLKELKQKVIVSEDFFYDFRGNYSPSFTQFAIEYYLNHKYHLLTKKEKV